MEQYIGKGMNVYVSGNSLKGDKNSHGFGMHYYIFNNEEPKQKHFPVKGIVPTTFGYMDKKQVESIKIKDKPNIFSKETFCQWVLNNEQPFVVDTLYMKEYAQGFDEETNTQTAGLKSVIQALKAVLEHYPDVAIIHTTSTYSIRGLSKFTDWIEKEWIDDSGRPVPNKPLWEELNKLLIMAKSNGIQVKLLNISSKYDKKKDGLNNVGVHQLFTNKLASIGSSITQGLIHGIDPTDNNGVMEMEIGLDDLKEDKDPELIHPFLVNNRLYFTFGGRENKNVFYTGNPGHQVEDIYIGKQIPDAQIGIVFLKDRVKNIELIEEEQDKWLTEHYGYNNLMYCICLDVVSSSKTYRELSKYGRNFIGRDSSKVPNLVTPTLDKLTYVHDPVYLAAKNIDRFVELSNILTLYKEQSPLVKEVDITHVLYETETKEVQEDIQGLSKQYTVGKSFKKEYDTSFKSLRLPIKFGADHVLKEEIEKDIILSTGIDILKRNQLKKLETELPNLKLLVWNKTDYVYAYALVITLHDKLENGLLAVRDYGIWSGMVCSQILVK